jgi:catecholate siderophore receptor
MIFGRGGAGGVINRVSKEAGWDPISQITTSFGAYDHKRISGDYGQALNDEIAFRINAVYEDSGSYRNGVDLERYGVTPTVTIKPDEKSKIVLGVEYFKDKRTTDRGVPSLRSGIGATADLGNRPYRIGDEDTFFGNADLSQTETETVALNAMFEHLFDNGIGIKNRTRMASYDKYYQNVFASSSVNNNDNVAISAYRDDTRRDNIINQTDITYSLKTGSVEHKLLAGAEFSVQDTANKRVQPSTANGVVNGTVPASNPTVPTASFNTLQTNQKSDVTVAAFYLQDQIIFSPQWQAIVGLRNDNFDTDYVDVRANPDISINASDNLLSPRIGFIFKPIEALSLYTNYSVSYVPRAGDQLTSLRVTNASFDPEKFINREIGAKWDINSDLSFTAAIYKLERENVLAIDPASGGTQSVLLDGQETKGIELSLAGNITEKWSIYGGIAFQDGEITKAQTVSPNTFLKGAELGQTPDRTASLWNKYQINDIWAVALGIVSRSEMYALTPTTTASTILPGYTRFDAAVFAQLNKKTLLQINLENLTNKEYALYAHNNNNISPGSPITGRATLIYNF